MHVLVVENIKTPLKECILDCYSVRLDSESLYRLFGPSIAGRADRSPDVCRPNGMISITPRAKRYLKTGR